MNRVSPPGREPQGRWIALLAASVVVHGAVLSTLSAVPSVAPVSELREVEVTFEAVEVPSPVAVVDPVPEEPAPPNIAIPVAPRKASRRPEALEPTASVPERSEPTPRPKLVLDAATAARAFFVVQQSVHNGASEGEGESPGPIEAETPDYFEGVGEKQYLSRREPPRLQRHRDGTYRYRGQAFKAIVEKDGSVVFDDGYRQGATVRFDITDAMMRRRGEDPYRVEKKWFLEGTAAFREELLEHHIAKQTFIALRKLRRRLLHISEDGMLSDREKSARVIAIFQDTTDDETGAAARSAIAEFVAERMPATELPLELR
ncbi:MAG: hypothetical protein WBN38_10010 [Polyangiales bacterium]